MLTLTFALGAAAVLGLAFESTRSLGVLFAALFGWLHPFLFLVLLLIAAGAYLIVQQRRD